MACLGPITAFYAKDKNPSGKRSLVFDKKASHSGIPVEIRCGQCINCRIQTATDNAVRCYHEAKSHDVSSFVTLTYDDAHLPEDGGLDHRDFQLFMKRLRAKSDFKFKYVMCGEYGETTHRAHYHALLFGCDFSDRKKFRVTPRGDTLFTSELLNDTWQKGHCTVGEVTFESCRYVTGYVLNKVTGRKAADYYMGRRPDYVVWGNGISLDYFNKFGPGNYPGDFIVLDGKKVKIPRYYDTKFEALDPVAFDSVKKVRVRKAKDRPDDLSNRRSWTREKVALARRSRYNRRDANAS